MHRGYIKFWRKIEDSGITKDPALLSVWIHILLNVTHKKIKTKFNGDWIELQPGQFVTGRHKIAEATSLTPKIVRRCLRDLSGEGLDTITAKRSNQGTLITVKNWVIYQGNGTEEGQPRASEGPAKGQQKANESTTKGQPRATIQECKNDKNGKKEEEGKRFKPPTAEEVKQYAEEKNLYYVNPDRFIDFYISKNWMVGKNKMKDWKAAARNWHRRQFDEQGKLKFEEGERRYPKAEEI